MLHRGQEYFDQAAQEWIEHPVPTLHLTPAQRDIVAALATPLAPAFAAATASEQRWIGQLLADRIATWVPAAGAHVERVLAEDPVVRICGLPADELLAPVLTVALSAFAGETFNYEQQNEGALAQAIAARAGVPSNSNASPEPFGWHCDDSGLMPIYRTEWIALFGVRNPTFVTTGIARLDDLLVVAREAGLEVREATRPQFSKRLPKSFNFGEDVWIENLPLIETDELSAPAVAWPTYATKPTDPNNVRAGVFLAELASRIPLVANQIAVNAGHFVIFSNSRVLHSRGAIGNADRLLFRCYVRRDLDALKAATAQPGPVFDLLKIVAAQFGGEPSGRAGNRAVTAAAPASS